MRTPLAVSILFGLFALAACAKSGNQEASDQPAGQATTPPASQPAGSSSTPLENTYWRLVELGGKPATVVQGPRESHLRFEADSSRVGGATGCNQMGGPYTRSGDTLTFGALISTKMACMESNLMDQERDFLGALHSTARHQISGDTLTLLASDGRPLAKLVAAVR